jgi:hypothetical protein
VLIAPMTQWRIGLARIVTLLATILFSTWGAVKFVLDWVGRTTAADDYHEFLKRVPRWAEWLFSTPGWVPAVLATALAIFLVWLSWPQKRKELATTRAASVSDAPPTTVSSGTTGTAGPAGTAAPYVKDAHVAPGSVRFNNWPEYRAIPVRKGYNATVYVEYQYFSKSVMNPKWTKRKRILLLEIDKFDVGEWSIIKIPLIGQYTKDGETRWRWGGEQIEPNDTAYWLHRESWYRARIVFIAPGGEEEYCYFKIEPLEENAGQMPHIVGQSHFDFINDWKEADAQIGNAS